MRRRIEPFEIAVHESALDDLGARLAVAVALTSVTGGTERLQVRGPVGAAAGDRRHMIQVLGGRRSPGPLYQDAVRGIDEAGYSIGGSRVEAFEIHAGTIESRGALTGRRASEF